MKKRENTVSYTINAAGESLLDLHGHKGRSQFNAHILWRKRGFGYGAKTPFFCKKSPIVKNFQKGGMSLCCIIPYC